MNGLEVSWEDHLTHMDVVHVLYTVSRCRWLFHWIPSAAHKPVYTCNTHTHTHSCHTREVLLDSIMHISKCTQYVMEMTYVVWCRLLMSSPCKTSLVSNNKWSHSIWPAWPLPTCCWRPHQSLVLVATNVLSWPSVAAHSGSRVVSVSVGMEEDQRWCDTNS